MQLEQTQKYTKKGQVANSAIGSIIALVVGVGIVVVVVIFISVLSGTTYTLTESSFSNFTNSTMGLSVSTSLNASVLSGFTTFQTTSSYIPLVVLAVIIFIVLSLVLGFTMFSRGQTGGSSAL